MEVRPLLMKETAKAARKRLVTRARALAPRVPITWMILSHRDSMKEVRARLTRKASTVIQNP